MKHVYLTQEEITKSLHAKAITAREADELSAQIRRCHEFYTSESAAV